MNGGNETQNSQPSSSTNQRVISQQPSTKSDKTYTNTHMDVPLVSSNTVAKILATSTISRQKQASSKTIPEKSMVMKSIKLEPSGNDAKPQQITENSGKKQISKSGNWLETKDSNGKTYYYHRITR